MENLRTEAIVNIREALYCYATRIDLILFCLKLNPRETIHIEECRKFINRVLWTLVRTVEIKNSNIEFLKDLSKYESGFSERIHGILLDKYCHCLHDMEDKITMTLPIVCEMAKELIKESTDWDLVKKDLEILMEINDSHYLETGYSRREIRRLALEGVNWKW